MLKLYQTFQELAPMMNMGGDAGAAPDMGAAFANMANNFSDNNQADGDGMADMLFSMLSPDQKEMFENLKTVMSEPPAE
ncbi:MAG: hypothetical protein K2O03_01260 [Lachnospiraceae bacterium]|nr:hypothetical protein [Lachnospiraceae bacterium]